MHNISKVFVLEFLRIDQILVLTIEHIGSAQRSVRLGTSFSLHFIGIIFAE
jgi:hypothetical protein